MDTVTGTTVRSRITDMVSGPGSEDESGNAKCTHCGDSAGSSRCSCGYMYTVPILPLIRAQHLGSVQRLSTLPSTEEQAGQRSRPSLILFGQPSIPTTAHFHEMPANTSSSVIETGTRHFPSSTLSRLSFNPCSAKPTPIYFDKLQKSFSWSI
ncbi:hypothetical protein BJ508DRAFT_181744 [Ascobolus immersus RN42]|uniref:Uncharacterized protein n=1 Tax=Ascobolus immersus RN42 TaxID=1160509 RepID=A0A3N4HS34_ASCIM|nr:hypothetical protein BJ508DRAFT_181744 [Ascobolus immersus RN42]